MRRIPSVRFSCGTLPTGGLLLFPVLLLLTGGCANPVASGLRSAADARSVPDDLTVVYDDRDPKWGGKRMTVRSDRTILAERVRPGEGAQAEPEVFRGRVSKDELSVLVKLLVDIEAWEQRAEEGAPQIDDARATLTVHLGSQRARIWEWANDVEAIGRVVQVRALLEGMLRNASAPPSDDLTRGEPEEPEAPIE